jgi:mercuric ion transport protein
MKVEFIYDPDCPNVAEARAQLLRAFTETGISPRWVEWSRDSATAPAYARGFGSPTLLVNGHDVAEQTSAHGNACCRLYADPSGALRGGATANAPVPVARSKSHESNLHRNLERG